MQMLEQLPVLPEAGLSRVISHFCYKPLEICEIYNILMKTKKKKRQFSVGCTTGTFFTTLLSTNIVQFSVKNRDGQGRPGRRILNVHRQMFLSKDWFRSGHIM